MYVIEDIDCLSGDLLKKRDEKSDTNANSNADDDEILASFQGKLSRGVGIGGEGEGEGGNNNINKDKGPSGYISSSTRSFSYAPIDEGTSASTSIKDLKKVKEDEIESDLDLSTVLNVMDGTLETPGRMIIITSNYPEKLDHAFIRPGRIDMIIEFKKANRQVIMEMFLSFYDIKADPSKIDLIDDYKWTPAEVSQIMFKYFSNPDKSLIDLIECDPKKYFKFSYFKESE